MGDQIGKGGLLSGALSRWRVQKALPYLSGKVLDFGCGRGTLASFVASENYIGVDRDEESLNVARTLYPNYTFVSETPPDMVFDSIAALAVIEHLVDPVPLFVIFAGMLNRGGNIVITTPHPISETIHKIGSKIGLFSKEANEEHENMYDRCAMSEMCAESCLDMVKYERFMVGMNQLLVLKHLL